MIARRILIAALGATALFSGWKPALSRPIHAPDKAVTFPPFTLQVSRRTLSTLAAGVTGYLIESHGKFIQGIWLRAMDGTVLLASVEGRPVRPLFEVFALSLVSSDELHARWSKKWTPPELPSDVPESFRTIMKTRPPEPAVPDHFTAWPLQDSRIDVLRRLEYVVEAPKAVDTMGDHPNIQSAMRPGTMPEHVQAACEVEVGLLFTAGDGRRLLIGVDWHPFKLVMLEEASDIDAYVELCSLTPIQHYLADFPADA